MFIYNKYNGLKKINIKIIFKDIYFNDKKI